MSKGASQNIQVDEPYYLGGLSEEIKENERLQGNVEVPAASGVLEGWGGWRVVSLGSLNCSSESDTCFGL